MLQIVTGMYFREGASVHKNLHRAAFYTNGVIVNSDPIDFPMGRLLFSTLTRGVAAVTVEAKEQLEQADGNFGMISTGGTDLLDDVASVLAFALNVSITRNEMRLREMVPSSIGVRSANRASRILARTFDPDVYLPAEAFDDAREFMAQLLKLNRRSFEAAMRAIRRVIDATYLVNDDPTMAYTLFVAALESLSQLVAVTKEHHWTQYPSEKAKIIDESLDGLGEADANRIRQAVLAVDQLSLQRQFISFTRGHVQASFYREEAKNAITPIRATDLPKALDFAYQLRSKNVHALQTLAPELYLVVDHAETLGLNNIRALGLEGLNRLTRHVIRTFVQQAPTDLDTTFNFRAHLPGQVRVRLAPEMWIGHPDATTRDSAATILDGFLWLLIGVLARREGAQLVDMRPALARVETLIRGENARDVRIPMVALYELWHTVVPPDAQQPDNEAFKARYSSDLDGPSLYAFVVRVLTGHRIEWSVDEVLKLVDERKAVLSRRPDQQLPPRLDAALILAAATLLRDEDPERAAALVSDAVEFIPGNQRLMILEPVSRDVQVPEIDLADFVLELGEWGTDEYAPDADFDASGDSAGHPRADTD